MSSVTGGFSGDGSTLYGRRVRLEPVGREDHEELYNLVANGDVPWQWGSNIFPGQEAFVESVVDRNRMGFAVFDASGRDPRKVIGYVGFYGVNLLAQNAFVLFGLHPDYRQVGWPFESVFLALDYAFQRFPLHKIYAEMTPDKYKQFASGEEAGIFELEATLKDHVFRGGALQDSLVLSMTRKRFEGVRPLLLRVAVGAVSAPRGSGVGDVWQ